MANYGTAKNFEDTDSELREDRERQALREFKELLADLVELLRQSTRMDTAYMYWVNHARQQFVKEVSTTRFENAMFQDRVEFSEHYLNEYRDITEPVLLEVSRHISETELRHYYNSVPVRYITLIPFINNGETIAITALESQSNTLTDDETAVFVYEHAISRLLNTYLEVNDLSESQQEWSLYEEAIERVQSKRQPIDVLDQLVEEIDRYIRDGGVTFLTRGMNSWCNVLNSKKAAHAPNIGMTLEERTIAYRALENGKPEFSIHFNSTPKRLAAREPQSNGATLAVPVMIHERRQGVIITWDENPLVFKESVKHKITNLIRIASLKLTASEPRKSIGENLLTNKYGAFTPDLWELIIKQECARLELHKEMTSWFGFITLDNLSSIRTRHRLDELQQLQKKLITQINPSQFGFTGLIGAKTDYVYAFFIQDENPEIVKTWFRELIKGDAVDITLSGGEVEQIEFLAGYTQLDSAGADYHDIVQRAKSALSDAVKNPEKVICKK